MNAGSCLQGKSLIRLSQVAASHLKNGRKDGSSMFESTFTGGWRFYSRPLIEEVHYAFALFWVLWVLLINFVTMRIRW